VLQISGNEIKKKTFAERVNNTPFYQQEINAKANSIKLRDMSKNKNFYPLSIRYCADWLVFM